MFVLLLGTLILFTTMSSSHGEFYTSNSVVNLTPKNFDQMVKNSKQPWVVQFYSPVCGYCKQFAPEYEKAAKKMKSSGVKFGVVDAIEYDELSDRYKVRGYPTVKMFGVDKTKPEDYTGKRTAQALMEQALQLTGNKVRRRRRSKRTKRLTRPKNK